MSSFSFPFSLNFAIIYDVLQFYDTIQGHLHIGTAKEADAKADVGLCVAIDANYLCFIVAFREVFDVDIFSDSEVCSCEVNVGFFLSEHLLKDLHVVVADSCQFVPTAYAFFLSGWVAHQS